MPPLPPRRPPSGRRSARFLPVERHAAVAPVARLGGDFDPVHKKTPSVLYSFFITIPLARFYACAASSLCARRAGREGSSPPPAAPSPPAQRPERAGAALRARAWHTRRPWKIGQWCAATQSLLGSDLFAAGARSPSTVLASAQPHPVGHAEHVRIHRDGGHAPKALASRRWRSCAPHAGQCGERLHGAGHLAAVVLLHDEAAGGDDVGGLVLKPQLLTIGLHVLHAGGGHVAHRGVALKERGRHLVDLLIGALGREHHGHQRLVGVAEMQLRPRVGIQRAKPFRIAFLLIRMGVRLPFSYRPDAPRWQAPCCCTG